MYRIPNRIFVGGIPQTASQEELRDYFSHFGHVKDARIITDPRGNSRGYGFVTYDSENDAAKVLNLKEEELVFKESKLNIGYAYRKKNFASNYNNAPNGMGGGGHGHGLGGGHGMGLNNGGMGGGLNNLGGLGGAGGHHPGNNNYLDAQMGGMHPLGGMNGGGGMHHHGMNLGGMNGHLGGIGNMAGMNGLNTINGLNGMNGIGAMNGMAGLNGMNMN